LFEPNADKGIGTNNGKRMVMVHSLWHRTMHVLQHTATVIAGIALIVLGLALTFSIVFAVPGIIVLALGVAIVAAGFFSHAVARP
jgi:hypothetical protein